MPLSPQPANPFRRGAVYYQGRNHSRAAGGGCPGRDQPRPSGLGLGPARTEVNQSASRRRKPPLSGRPPGRFWVRQTGRPPPLNGAGSQASSRHVVARGRTPHSGREGAPMNRPSEVGPGAVPLRDRRPEPHAPMQRAFPGVVAGQLADTPPWRLSARLAGAIPRFAHTGSTPTTPTPAIRYGPYRWIAEKIATPVRPRLGGHGDCITGAALGFCRQVGTLRITLSWVSERCCASPGGGEAS
jgi:hypothetical protein